MVGGDEEDMKNKKNICYSVFPLLSTGGTWFRQLIIPRTSFFHSFIHSLIHSLIHPFIHPFIHSFIHSSVLPYIQASIYSFIRPHFHAFMHTLFTTAYIIWTCIKCILLQYVHQKSWALTSKLSCTKYSTVISSLDIELSGKVRPPSLSNRAIERVQVPRGPPGFLKY